MNSKEHLQGQWLGRIDGDVKGLCVMDIDHEDGKLFGKACLYPDDPELPSTMAVIVNLEAKREQSLVCDILPIDPYGRPLTSLELKKIYPSVDHDAKAEIKFAYDNGKFEVKFRTDVSSGGGSLQRQQGDSPSQLIPEDSVTDWESFKACTNQIRPNEQYDVIYRGQPCIKRLRTTFHRTNRSDLFRYVVEDIPLLHRYLSPNLKHYFELNNAVHTGAFYNLLQHHGYPTPLLDWTYSPYIAAFFAFHSVDLEIEKKVRVFEFQKRQWQSSFSQISYVQNVKPRFSVIELLGIENQRMIPQQALSTLTNIDDIESYISDQSETANKTFLRVYELRSEEREKVLFELARMGITEATIFPGLDSSCKFMRSRKFEKLK